MQFFRVLAYLLAVSSIALASDDKKPHGHQGVLEAYTGKPITMKLTGAQNSKLDKGEAVMYNERSGSSGRGIVIQDVNASAAICMSMIRDIENYNKMVPHVKKVKVYDTKKFVNGTSQVSAKFDIGLMGMGFGYFLKLTHMPKYDTLTWTLDYSKNSDFDDNVGHWQLMPHPSKRGFTRILYSTKIKLFNWIPEFIIRFLTSKALTESTGWVKRESEKEAQKQAALGASKGLKGSWFSMNGGFRSQVDSALNKMEADIRKQKENFATSFRFPKFGFMGRKM